jgi:LacI family transcriptional regulator
MGARMKDIAEKLGVSLMTVSKSLRGHQDISEKTRKRVEKAARELNYHPNWIARSLVTKRTNLVGLVIPDLMHSFFAEVATGVNRVLEPLGYQLMMSSTEANAQTEARQIELLASRNVDGIIAASSAHGGGAFGMLRERKLPFVLIDRLVPGVAAHYVGVRDEEIGALAVRHLYEQGCRAIAHLRGPALSPGEGRLKGYRQTLKALGLKSRKDWIVQAGHRDQSGYAAMKRLLAAPERPDGVFCYNDPAAAGAIRAVLEAGLRIPQDIAIVGAGNIHYSDLLKIPLSTIDQSSVELGERAASLLMRSIAAEEPLPPETILIAPKLIVRESSRRR